MLASDDNKTFNRTHIFNLLLVNGVAAGTHTHTYQDGRQNTHTQAHHYECGGWVAIKKNLMKNLSL